MRPLFYHLKQACLLGVVGLFLCPFQALAQIHIQDWATAENMQVLLVEQHDLPMVDIQLIFPAGSSQDGKDYGLAALSASLIGDGTIDASAQDVARIFASTGALLGHAVERDHVTFSLRSLSEFDPLTRSFNLFSDLLAHPRISPEDFKQEKETQLVSIQYNESLPAYVAQQVLFAQLYGDDPYAHPRLGITETVRELKQAQTKEFIENYYVADRAVLVFVGDIQDVTARKFATQLSKALRKSNKRRNLDPDLSLKHPSSTHKKVMSTTQTQLAKGLLTMAENDPDRIALIVFNEILGGSSQSKMMEVIRGQQGLAYGAYSRLIAYQRPGPFVMNVQTRAEAADKAEHLMTDLLTQLVTQGPTVEEFKAAKQRLLGQFPLLFASNADIAVMVAWIGFYDYPFDYLDQYQKQLQDLTLDQMQKAVRSRIALDSVQTIVVGP